MKQQNSLKISVVVPCYNEEANIVACLNSLIAQKLQLHEIIVVDNNSTDKTAQLARSFKSIKVVNETKQGLISARNKGMNIATGDIIARIDADSRPANDWSQIIATTFVNEELQAITGTGYFYDAPIKRLVRSFRNVVAVRINNRILGHGMLWGSNMAMRRSCWSLVGPISCNRPNIMEDLDLASHVYEQFGSSAIVFVPSMRADISARRAMTGLKSNYLYLSMWPRTLSHHGYTGSFLSWPVVFMLLIVGIPASVALRLYSSDQEKFILSREQWRATEFYSQPNP